MTWLVPSAVPVVTDADVERVVAVLRSGVLANGPEAASLEEEFAAFCDVEHAVAVSSGTAALVLAGQALGLGAGDTVLVAGFTFAASANAFLSLGCRVVPVDVHPGTMNLDARALSVACERNRGAKAVVVVDLFGSTVGTDETIRVARAMGLAVIEDAAQAHGARTGDGSRVGARADATTFSLYATKNMAAGEGGIVTTPRADVADAVRRLRNHGMEEQYRHQGLGLNHRLPEMEAALARGQLAALDERTACRREHAALVTRWCAEAWGESVALPCEAVARDPRHVMHQLTARFASPARRDAVATALRGAGVDARVFYPYTVAELPGVAPGVTPVAGRLRDTVLSLPVHPGLTDDQLGVLRDAIAATATRP